MLKLLTGQHLFWLSAVDLRELGTEMVALSPESIELLRDAVQQQVELYEAETMTMQWEAQGPEDALAFNPPPIFAY